MCEASEPKEVGGYFEKRYNLLNTKLGAGSYGSVQEAECRLTGKAVAVKVYDKAAMNSRARCSVQAEINHLGALSHPGVVKLEGWYEDPEAIFVALEKLSGGDLVDWLEEEREIHGSCLEEDVAHVTAQLLRILAYLHSNGVVHRDIKLDNIMFKCQGCRDVALVDFGFATRIDAGRKLMGRCGSLQYLAPEVLSGNSYDERCDIYSLGSVVYALLTSHPPFQGDACDVHRKNSCGEVDWSVRFFSLSWQAQEFVQLLLCADPERRPRAAQALRHPWVRGRHLGATREEPWASDLAAMVQLICDGVSPRWKIRSIFKRRLAVKASPEVDYAGCAVHLWSTFI